jgi:hypothetical protein
MLSHVQDTYGDLLNESERDYLHALLGLPTDPQRLYARLLGRKGPWIRIDKLDYREVADLPGAIESLQQQKLVTVNDSAPADALLELLTQRERGELFPEVSGSNRNQWIENCVSRYSDAWIGTRLAASHPWIAITGLRHLRLCQLLFFGDDRQDLSAFVLQDLGLVRFEAYRLRRNQRLFPDREALDRFVRLRRLSGLSHRLGEREDLAEWLSGSLWQRAGSRHEQRQKDRILNRLGRCYERSRDYDRALACYARSTMHPSRERRARLLKKLEDPCASEALAARMGRLPRCAEEEDFASRFGQRSRRAAHRQTVIPLAVEPCCGIEAHAAAQIGAGGAAVFHLENSFPLSLTGLAFWEEIFADLPGAFSHPFQSGPLDLFWPDFAHTRATLLAERIARLEAPGRLQQALRDTYREKRGVANRLVAWRHFTEEVLELTLRHVPAAALLALVSYVIRWPYRTRTGFPDLVVIYGPNNFEFVEVKGPTDQLQPAQRIWLKALAELDLPARVLKYQSC